MEDPRQSELDNVEKGHIDDHLAVLSLDHVSPATQLLEKRRQMKEVHEALESQKKDYRRKEEHFKRREENLRKKDLELQEALVLFNKFLKENEAKRRRAERRAQEEVKQSKEKELEIIENKQLLANLKLKLRRLKRNFILNEKYHTFLQRVKNETESRNEFASVEGILSRYNCLQETYQQLMEKQKEVTEKLELQRAEFIQYHKDMHQANLSFNNDIARYSKEFEESQKRASKLEEKVDAIVRTESNRTLKISQIIMAVENLFQRCKRASKILNHSKSLDILLASSISEGNTNEGSMIKAQIEAKLGIILSYLTDFQDIVQKYGKFDAKEDS